MAARGGWALLRHASRPRTGASRSSPVPTPESGWRPQQRWRLPERRPCWPAGTMSERPRPATKMLRRHPTADVELLRLDLADLRQVADAAAEATERFSQIHVLVNNAGLIARSRSITVDGFETTFGVNHLGHFAWTGHLLPALLAAPDSRVVTVSSLAHLQATMRWDDLMGEQEFKSGRRLPTLQGGEPPAQLRAPTSALAFRRCGCIGHLGGRGAPGHRCIDVLGERRGTSTPARRPDLRRWDRRDVQHDSAGRRAGRACRDSGRRPCGPLLRPSDRSTVGPPRPRRTVDGGPRSRGWPPTLGCVRGAHGRVRHLVRRHVMPDGPRVSGDRDAVRS